ncbi:MAG TPA: hypothetical protein PLO78_05335 [Candidatus Omnitrophota bacterium]|nr:hypothetical protein [Candidatus Omnitrophota bacterium]
MSTLEMSKRREMSPNVRDVSRFRRYAAVQVIEMPRRESKKAISKAKFVAILVFASFLLVTMVNEGVRTWLKYSGGRAEASTDFMVPRSPAVIPHVNQPVIIQSKPADQVGLLREQNRYRVDMTREQNRFVHDVLGVAERLTGRLGR